jgi:hypothetical protein
MDVDVDTNIGSVGRAHTYTVGNDILQASNGTNVLFGDDGFLLENVQQGIDFERTFLSETALHYDYLRDLQQLVIDFDHLLYERARKKREKGGRIFIPFFIKRKKR